MFSLARRRSPRICHSLLRPFASAVPETPANTTNGIDWRTGKVPVREDHGLYGFFRRKANPSAEGEAAYETVESARKPMSGAFHQHWQPANKALITTFRTRLESLRAATQELPGPPYPMVHYPSREKSSRFTKGRGTADGYQNKPSGAGWHDGRSTFPLLSQSTCPPEPYK